MVTQFAPRSHRWSLVCTGVKPSVVAPGGLRMPSRPVWLVFGVTLCLSPSLPLSLFLSLPLLFFLTVSEGGVVVQIRRYNGIVLCLPRLPQCISVFLAVSWARFARVDTQYLHASRPTDFFPPRCTEDDFCETRICLSRHRGEAEAKQTSERICRDDL